MLTCSSEHRYHSSASIINGAPALSSHQNQPCNKVILATPALSAHHCCRPRDAYPRPCAAALIRVWTSPVRYRSSCTLYHHHHTRVIATIRVLVFSSLHLYHHQDIGILGTQHWHFPYDDAVILGYGPYARCQIVCNCTGRSLP